MQRGAALILCVGGIRWWEEGPRGRRTVGREWGWGGGGGWLHSGACPVAGPSHAPLPCALPLQPAAARPCAHGHSYTGLLWVVEEEEEEPRARSRVPHPFHPALSALPWAPTKPIPLPPPTHFPRHPALQILSPGADSTAMDSLNGSMFSLLRDATRLQYLQGLELAVGHGQVGHRSRGELCTPTPTPPPTTPAYPASPPRTLVPVWVCSHGVGRAAGPDTRSLV